MTYSRDSADAFDFTSAKAIREKQETPKPAVTAPPVAAQKKQREIEDFEKFIHHSPTTGRLDEAPKTKLADGAKWVSTSSGVVGSVSASATFVGTQPVLLSAPIYSYGLEKPAFTDYPTAWQDRVVYTAPAAVNKSAYMLNVHMSPNGLVLVKMGDHLVETYKRKSVSEYWERCSTVIIE